MSVDSSAPNISLTDDQKPLSSYVEDELDVVPVTAAVVAPVPDILISPAGMPAAISCCWALVAAAVVSNIPMTA